MCYFIILQRNPHEVQLFKFAVIIQNGASPPFPSCKGQKGKRALAPPINQWPQFSMITCLFILTNGIIYTARFYFNIAQIG